MRNGDTRYKKFMTDTDDDPLNSLTNLFDVAMVFSVALIIAMLTVLPDPSLVTGEEDITIVKNAGKKNMEIIMKKGVKIDRYKMSKETASGNGHRLGIAYRLPSGEVVYVPEQNSQKSKENKSK